MSIRPAACAFVFALAAFPALAQEKPPAPTTTLAAPPVISPATEAELAALAAKTALPAGTRLLCLGDSITAVSARQSLKYPEMIGQALAKKYGDKAQVLNAGKGGDSVPGALKRVETDVIEKRPTLVFINLGVNDSKLAAPDHAKNVVPLDQFTAGYRDLIKLIQEKTGATVVVVGTLACVDEYTRAAATGEKKRNYFGKPEELKKYNAAAKEIAAEFKCDYVDLFDLFMAQPDLKALFPGDGVHANQKGQELIALQLMKHLARKYPAK
jgi:lysophospholipase L1-like esterase